MNNMIILSWICRIIVAIILFQTLFFKFTGAEESKYIFSTLMGENEAIGRIGSGIVELIAVILLLIPNTAWLGALLALGTIIGAVHGIFSIIQFHALGDVNPIVSLLTSNTRFFSVADFPFQILGFVALIILFLMAITSHDFWLKNLTAPVWKTLHTLVYVAYALLIAHILLGVLQAETNSILLILLGFGVFSVGGLHLFAGFREAKSDKEIATTSNDFVDVCSVDEIPEKRACIATVSGERVAIFKYDGKISAVSNVCQHQNGPLGEGKIIDGCITCPWHGFQYLPANGQSPPPFTEKIPTFQTKIENGRVFVNPKPEIAGTFVEPTEVL